MKFYEFIIQLNLFIIKFYSIHYPIKSVYYVDMGVRIVDMVLLPA